MATTLTLARRAAVPAVAALALLSAAITFPHAWSWASSERSSFEGLASPEIVFKYQQLLPEEAVIFARAHLRPRDRYYVLPRPPAALFAALSPPPPPPPHPPSPLL